MSALVQAADQLAESVRGLLPGALGQAQNLLGLAQQAQQTPDACLLMQASSRFSLIRPEGSWHCLSLSFRPGGSCLVDLDGESYLLEQSGQVLDARAQDSRQDEILERLEKNIQRTPAPPQLSFKLPDFIPTDTHPHPHSQPPLVVLVPDHAPEAIIRVESEEVECQGPIQAVRQGPDLRLSCSQPPGPENGYLALCRLRARGGAQTDVPVLVARPGPQVLNALPIQIQADGKACLDLQVSLWRWNPSAAQLEVDEAGLAQLTLEAPLSPAFQAAELHFEPMGIEGAGLSRHILYRLRAPVAIPGEGSVCGHMKVTAADSRRLEIPIQMNLDPLRLGQQLSREEEWRLLRELLDSYFEENVFSQLLRTAVEQASPPLAAERLRYLRKWILKETVLAWKTHGRGYREDANYCHRLLEVARAAGWQPFRGAH